MLRLKKRRRKKSRKTKTKDNRRLKLSRSILSKRHQSQCSKTLNKTCRRKQIRKLKRSKKSLASLSFSQILILKKKLRQKGKARGRKADQNCQNPSKLNFLPRYQFRVGYQFQVKEWKEKRGEYEAILYVLVAEGEKLR